MGSKNFTSPVQPEKLYKLPTWFGNTPCTRVQYSEILLLRLCLQNPTTQSAGERYEYVLQHKQEVHCCDDHSHTIQLLQHSPKHFSALCHSNANNPTHANTLESTIHLCIRVKLWVLVKIHFCTVSHSCRNSTSDCVNKDTHIWWWHHHIKIVKKNQGLDWTKKGRWNVKPIHHAQTKMNQNNWKERFIPIPAAGVWFQASWWIEQSFHHQVMPPDQQMLHTAPIKHYSIRSNLPVQT